MHEVYKIAPDFSPELYRELHDDLKPFNDIKLFEHYYNYGRYEVRVYSYSKFYGKYRDFSIELYRELQDDLKSFTDIKLFGHYHKYGCREGRISSYNKFYEKYLYFSLELYRELYDDLESFNDIQLFGHYHKYGCKEGRISSYNKFYEVYPDFDVEFYRNCNYDLESFTDIQLFGHYHKYGCKEGRISSYNKFYEVYPNFDVEFYRRFNPDLIDFNKIELFSHFHKIGSFENRTYFKVNIYNLNFNELQKYYDLYLNNNEYLKNIINENIKKYTFDYNLEKYFRLDPDNIITRIINENYNLIIIGNSIINENMIGYCIKTGKKYICEKISLFENTNFHWPYIVYYFNCSDDNEFLIYFIWEYNNPILIYYPKNNEIFNISYRYSDIDGFLHNYPRHYMYPVGLHTQNVYYDYLKKYNQYNINDKKMKYCFGFMPNSGHYLWNEVFGLMFLIESNLLNNINEFIIGCFDYLDIASILKNKFNKKITYSTYKDIDGINIGLSKVYINQKILDTFIDFYDIDINKINDDKIHIMFDIRTNSRVWLNQENDIINIIKEITQYFPDKNFIFYIAGWFIINDNISENDQINIDKQNNIFNFIQSNFEFKIINLIGKKIKNLIKIYENINIFISNTGSSNMYYGIIFDKFNIYFTNKSIIKDSLNQNIALNNIKNLWIIDEKYITDIDDNFYIEYKQIILYLIDIIKINYIT